MLTGDRNEPEEIKRLSRNLQKLMDPVIDSALTHAIYTGLIEAMDNCATHAYPEDHEFRYPTEQGRWWMSGSVANDRELEVIFFDQGATIPGTLPHSGMREIAYHWMQQTLISPLKKASLTGFHATAKHIAAKAVSPSSETMRTI